MSNEWVMVPREPTAKQLVDGAYEVPDPISHRGELTARMVYRAMLDAAPAAPEQQADEITRLRAEVEALKATLTQQCKGYRADVEKLEAEVETLRGITPELPPRPPDGGGLPRYGLRHNGQSMPMSVPMADGYWTPYHLAIAEVEALRAERQVLNSAVVAAKSETAEFAEVAINAQNEVEALRADAELYRWLRAQHWHDGPMCVVVAPKQSVKLGADCPSEERLDAFIYAARAAQGDKT